MCSKEKKKAMTVGVEPATIDRTGVAPAEAAAAAVAAFLLKANLCLDYQGTWPFVAVVVVVVVVAQHPRLPRTRPRQR